MTRKSPVKSYSPMPRELEGQTEAKRRYLLLRIWFVTLGLKVLLSVGYHSTDFEVHRNWLALTHKLPLKEWYTESTSQWTLDYPPFFAYFEWILSQMVPRSVVDDGCLDLVVAGNYGMKTVLFQRLTVMISELVLYVSLQWYINTAGSYKECRRAYVVATSLVLSPGLLIIDHIHFQYNGMLYGFLVLVIVNARLENYLMCGFWFSVLLCFKHIYLYLAPAVFVYLLVNYCLNLKFDNKALFPLNLVKLVRWKNLAKLSMVVVGVFTVAFGPFAYYGVLPQLFNRLFPFSRGLTHAYWAPNIWAIYSAIDRVLIQVYYKIPITRSMLQNLFKFDPALLLDSKLVNSSTRGIVGDVEFLILPKITPKLSFVLTLFYQIMALIPLILQTNFRRFVGALTLCGYASFLFGWHVHEKAILIVIFPMSFLVSRDKELLDPFNLLVSSGYVSLFPLIFTPEEWLIKITYTLLWFIIFYFNFKKVVRIPKTQAGLGSLLLGRVTNGFILGFVPLVIMLSLVDLFEAKFAVLKKLQFLKLIIYSTYCGVGIISSWNNFSWSYFVTESIWNDE